MVYPGYLQSLAWLLALLAAAPAAAQELPPAIEDNSFFIEEAYNQEARVVQHIFNAQWSEQTGEWVATFTQEWPLGGQRHQLSYTIPYLLFDPPAGDGVGDVLLNYRYQLRDSDGGWALAPRLSAVLPTGDPERGLGNDVLGWQVNLPASRRLGPRGVLHLNAGATLLPGVEAIAASSQDEETLLSPFLGASWIWLARPKVNFLVEWLTVFEESLTTTGSTDREAVTVVSPGVRLAVDVGDLQIVPGLAFPMTWSAGESDIGVFLYLSFEHPF